MEEAAPYATPDTLLPFLQTVPLLAGLPPALLRELAETARYLELPSGEALLRQGDEGDALYIILDGCLEARDELRDGTHHVLGTAGRGEVVGEMAVLSGDPRSCAVVAVRESSVLRLGRDDFQRILSQHPAQLFPVVKQIIRRASAGPARRRPPATIAVVPSDDTVDVAAFLPRLTEALGAHCSLRVIRREEAAAHAAARDEAALFRDHRLLGWLAQEERAHELVLYEAEPRPGGWTRRCLAQAELVLLLADPRRDGAWRPVESLLWRGTPVTQAPIELVLLHRTRGEIEGTRRFLDPRPRLRLHHHVALDRPGDMQRLARILTGRAMQLVLSGGGARGLAHLGVVRALDELGVPIDMVGGASMGAFVSVLRALEWDAARAHQAARQLLLGGLHDVTLPVLSLIRGEQGCRLTRELFGERRLEDLWINCFSLSADLRSGEVVVHRQGTLWEAMRVAVSLPGLLPPVHREGRYLVDGGVLNNLPTDVMAELCQGTMIASDVVLTKAFEVHEPLPLNVSGVGMLLRKARAVTGTDVNISDIVVRAVEIASARISALQGAPAALTLNPPTRGFRLLDFRPIDEIAIAGYRYARTLLAQDRAQAVLRGLPGRPASDRPRRRSTSPRGGAKRSALPTAARQPRRSRSPSQPAPAPAKLSRAPSRPSRAPSRPPR